MPGAREPMPFTQTATGMNLHYDEQGSGRPVLFLHGWAMSGRVWRFQRRLLDDRRLIFLDQRGHGQSSPADCYALEDFAGDLVSFCQELELEGAVLVCWSMAVQVALQAFPALSQRLAGMVLVGGTPRFTAADDFPHGKPPVEVKGLGVRLKRDYQKTMGEFFRGMFVEGEMDGAQYQRIVHEIVMGGKSPDQAAALKALQILSTADLRDRLPLVDRPVLLVHGESDSICSVAASEYMAQRLPMATLKVMAGCGHAPFMTQPERFNELVRSFLRELPESW